MPKPKLNKQAVGTRVAPTTYEFLSDTFSSPAAGSTYVLDTFASLYHRTLKELRGRFAQGELMLILEVSNGPLDPCHAGGYLLPRVGDGIILDGLDKKWEISGPAMLEKLSALSTWQVACLEIWARTLWESEEHGEGGAAERWCERLEG